MITLVKVLMAEYLFWRELESIYFYIDLSRLEYYNLDCNFTDKYNIHCQLRAKDLCSTIENLQKGNYSNFKYFSHI